MKKLVVMMAAVPAIAAIISASDASAQSWGRRGANVRCMKVSCPTGVLPLPRYRFGFAAGRTHDKSRQ